MKPSPFHVEALHIVRNVNSVMTRRKLISPFQRAANTTGKAYKEENIEEFCREETYNMF
jgi:hypothetical protein